MHRKLVLRHRALHVCALICLSLLLLGTLGAPIHKHNSGQDASCLFCHATTRAEWPVPAAAEGQPLALALFAMNQYTGRAAVDDAEQTVRIPRAPPSQLLSR
jgi:hypothetical protein